MFAFVKEDRGAGEGGPARYAARVPADAEPIPVLVADDEEQLLSLCGRVLGREGLGREKGGPGRASGLWMQPKQGKQVAAP